MKILSISLENFQGIKKEKFDFDGHSATIFGDNGTGKTTVLNAHCWLLFGRSGSGIKGYTPKSNDSEGGVKHNLDHAAEETIELETGERRTYGRIYHEVYKKTRGKAEQEFDGNTVDYYINGVSTAEKEYEASISALAGGDTERLKILTIPQYFSGEMSYQDRRKVLMSAFGSVTDEDVIKNSASLSALPEALKIPGSSNMYSVDDYRKIASAKKTKINDDLKTIPARISEAEKAAPNIDGIDADKIETGLKALRESLTRLDAAHASDNAPGAEAQTALKKAMDAETDIISEKNKYMAEQAAARSGIMAKINALENEKAKLEKSLRETRASAENKTAEIQRKEKLRESLIAEYRAAYAEKWDESKSSCPTCGRELPDIDIERLKKMFNETKSKKLELINLRGKSEASAEMILKEKQEVALMSAEIDSISVQIDNVISNITALNHSIPFEDFESTQKCAEMRARLRELTESAHRMTPRNESKDAEYESARRKISAQISELDVAKKDIETYEKQKARVKELEAEEKKLAREYEKLESDIFLCDQFVREKVRLMTEPINGQFETVRFRLFAEQVNGALREDCEVMIPSPFGDLVPYSSANHAAKTTAGIEIIKVLSKKWGMNVPIFIDDAEHITEIPDTGAQTILLSVSKGIKPIRISLK
ncbi:MAG TPA: AAA family ATPase [Candidatus Omnitrophota bacterium]|nr:AAA family ATPase [Candidatus Omnitrophota bacterium]